MPLKRLIDQVGWELGTFEIQTGSLFTTVTFILSRLLQDYRITEDLPLQITNTIPAIQYPNQMIDTILISSNLS